MPAFDVVRRWKGRVALDRDGHRIGSVVDVYYDAETDEPGWALLDLEQADGKTSLVPLGEANELAVGIQLPFELATVQRAPGMPAGGRLWPQDEAALYRYYGLEYTGASLVDLDELEGGEGNGSVDRLGDVVKVGPSPRWLLNVNDAELSGAPGHPGFRLSAGRFLPALRRPAASGTAPATPDPQGRVRRQGRCRRGIQNSRMRELNGELTRCRWRATFCQSFGLVATLNTAAGRELPMRSRRSSTAKKRTSSSPCWLSQSSTARCSSPTLVVIQITADTSRPAAKVTTWPRWMWSVVSSWLVMATRRPLSVWARMSTVKEPTAMSRPTSRRPLTPSSLESLSRFPASQPENPSPSRWKTVRTSTSSRSASCTEPPPKLRADRSRSTCVRLLPAWEIAERLLELSLAAALSDWVTLGPFIGRILPLAA